LQKRKVENASHSEETKVFLQSRLCIITQTETEAIAESVFIFQSVDAEKAEEVIKELQY